MLIDNAIRPASVTTPDKRLLSWDADELGYTAERTNEELGIATDASIATAVAAEATARAGGDATNAAAIAAEATTRGNADLALAGSLDAEATTRAGADTALSAAIAAEAVTRAAADATNAAAIATKADAAHTHALAAGTDWTDGGVGVVYFDGTGYTSTLYPSVDGLSSTSGTIYVTSDLYLDGYSIDTNGGTIYAGEIYADGGGLYGLTKAQVGLSNVANVDTTNAGNIASGTLNSARLPTSVPGDWTIGGDLRVPNVRVLSLDRTIPTTVGTAVALGTFTVTNGGAVIEASVTVGSGSFSLAKRYLIPVQAAADGNWYKVEATSSTGAYIGQDVDLEVRNSGNSASLRLRRTAGTTAGVAKCVVTYAGYASDAWTPSVVTTAAATVAGRYVAAQADALLSSVLQVGSFVSGTSNGFSLLNYQSQGYAVRSAVWAPTNNGGSTPAAPQVVTVWGREGAGGQSFDNYAAWAIGRSVNDSVNSRTVVTLSLAHLFGAASIPDAFSFHSDSTLQLHQSRTPASATATGSVGMICWDASYLYVCTATNTWRRVAHATW